VEQALRCVMYAVDSTQVCETKPRDGSAPGDDEATFTAESTTAVPVDGTAVAGYAMVVVAGAVGGALLWWTVLQRSFVLGVLPLLSRISHSEIYTNDARRLIAQIATQNPGLCLNEIVARTGYSRNAVSYHLFVLEKEAEIVSIKDGKYRRYFPRGGKYVNGAKNVVSALRNETTLKMAQHIVANPGTIQRDLCQLLGTTASAACWHAKRLEQLGVIRKQRVANTVKYFPGEALDKHDYSDFGLATARAEPAPVAPLPSSMPGLPA
jgi:predicted transcriptional regulator